MSGRPIGLRDRLVWWSIRCGLAAVWLAAAVGAAGAADAPAEPTQRDAELQAAKALFDRGFRLGIVYSKGKKQFFNRGGSEPFPEDFEHVYHLAVHCPDVGPDYLRNALKHFKHLEVLELRPGRSLESHADDAWLEVLKDYPELRELSMKRSMVKGPGFAHLTGLKKLEVLDLGYSRSLQDEALKHISQLQGLRHLDLTCVDLPPANITATGCAYLGANAEHLPNLERLTLPGMADGATACAHLKKLKSLKYLCLPGCTDEGCAHLAELPQLEYLITSHVGDAGFAHLAKIHTLIHLHNSVSRITDDGFAPLKQMRNLEYLGIPQTGVLAADGISPDALKHFKDAWALQIVNLSGNLRIDDEAVPHLARIRLLTLANVSNTKISRHGRDALFFCMLANEGWSSSARHYCDFYRPSGYWPLTDESLAILAQAADHFKRLNLGHSNLSSRGLALLAKFTNATNFNLEYVDVTDDDLVHLKKLHRLDGLNLSHTKITSRGLAHLTELPNLEDLYLEGTAVDDSAVPLLKKMPKLNKVDLQSTKVSEQGKKELGNKLIW